MSSKLLGHVYGDILYRQTNKISYIPGAHRMSQNVFLPIHITWRCILCCFTYAYWAALLVNSTVYYSNFIPPAHSTCTVPGSPERDACRELQSQTLSLAERKVKKKHLVIFQITATKPHKKLSKIRAGMTIHTGYTMSVHLDAIHIYNSGSSCGATGKPLLITLLIKPVNSILPLIT